MNLKTNIRKWPLIAAAAALTGLAFGLVGGAETSQAAPAQQSVTCNWESAGRAANDLFHSASAMDTDKHHLYIYGGVDGSFSGQSTIERGDFSGPNASATNARVAVGGALERIGAAGAYRAKGDTDMSGVYFIGGIGDPAKGQGEGDIQVYATKAGSFSKLQASASDRAFATATYVPDQDAIWIIGGVKSCVLGDVLMGQTCQASSVATQYITFDAMTGDATVNTLSGANVSNYGHSAVYDSANKRILIYGGTNDISRGNSNLIALDVSDPDPSKAKVANVSTSGTSPRVFFHGAAYDPGRNWMIVAGGVSQGFLQRNESTENKTYALDLSQATPTWVDLKTSIQDRVAGAMVWDANHNVALYTLGRNKFNGDASRPQNVARTSHALVCQEVTVPTDVPTQVPSPTNTPGGPTDTPPPVATTPVPAPPETCDIAKSKVPGAVLADAFANPQSVAGYGLRCNPNLPAGPFNGERKSLSLRNPGLPYHPLFNGVIWKCGCP